MGFWLNVWAPLLPNLKKHVPINQLITIDKTRADANNKINHFITNILQLPIQFHSFSIVEFRHSNIININLSSGIFMVTIQFQGTRMNFLHGLKIVGKCSIVLFGDKISIINWTRYLYCWNLNWRNVGGWFKDLQNPFVEKEVPKYFLVSYNNIFFMISSK